MQEEKHTKEQCRNCGHWAAEWMHCRRHDMKTDSLAYCPEWTEIFADTEEKKETEPC